MAMRFEVNVRCALEKSLLIEAPSKDAIETFFSSDLESITNGLVEYTNICDDNFIKVEVLSLKELPGDADILLDLYLDGEGEASDDPPLDN
jgi:hypothetical protein